MINNQVMYIEATAENTLPLMQAVSDIVGIPLDEEGVMWLNSEHTLGIYAKATSSALSFCLRCCGSENTLSSFKLGGGYLTYNCSKNKTVYAFGSTNNSSMENRLSWAIVNENGEPRVIDCTTAKTAEVYMPEYPNCISYPLNTAADARIAGVTLAGMPSLRSPKPFSELYQILSTSNSIWKYDDTIIADGVYYKFITTNSPSTGTGALVFPVSD